MIQNWHIARRKTPTTCINPKAHEIFEARPISSRPNSNTNLKESKKGLNQVKLRLLSDTSSADSALSHVPLRWKLRDITTTMTDFILNSKTFNREAYELNLRGKKERERAKINRTNLTSSVGLLSGHESFRAQTGPLYQDSFTSMKRLSAIPQALCFMLTPPTSPERQDNPQDNSEKSGDKLRKPSANGMDYDHLLYPCPLRIRCPSPLRKDNSRSTPFYDNSLLEPSENPLVVLPRHSIKRKPLTNRLLPKLSNNPPAVPPLEMSKNLSPGLSIPANKVPEPRAIKLRSTRFTLNSPRFLHGPIRIEQQQQYSSPEDKSLDWMAFQNSIIGVLDEYANGRDDGFCKAGEVELDDLASWFSDFGLAIGSMEKEGPDGWIQACV